MALAQWIPYSWQIGDVAPEAARPGIMRQALVEGIKRHLFGEVGPEPRTDLAQAVAQFSTRVALFASIPESRAPQIWAALLSPVEPIPASGSPSSDPMTALFCLAVQGLCVALVSRRPGNRNTDTTGTEDAGQEDSDGEGDRDEDPVDANNPSVPDGLWVEWFRAVDAIAGQLQRALWRTLRDVGDDEAADTEEEIRLIAALLLDHGLLKVMGAWFEARNLATEREDGAPGRSSLRIIACSPALAERIKALLIAVPAQFTLQPLRQPPSYELVRPRAADDDGTDRTRIDLIGYRRTNAFMRRLLAEAIRSDKRIERYVSAVNRQQAVPWRINAEVLYWVLLLSEIASGKVGDGAAAALAELSADEVAGLGEWTASNFYRPTGRPERRRYERSAEFMDHVLMRKALIGLVRPDGERIPFYLPWKADYRGRIYAATPWLTPQGGDVQRALLEFANGQVLNELGVKALCRHGANLVRRGQILADLRITAREVVTLDERERWVELNREKILASAESPLREPFWRDVSNKPVQFLAFCIAFAQWSRFPHAPLHLPVQIDGTCNGLQHIAALTGDEALARAVNVRPREDGLPADIYTELAEAARGRVGRLSFDKVGSDHRAGLTLANDWLAASETRRGWLNRGTAKKVVMTIPYGASEGAQARYVLEQIAEELEQEWRHSPKVEGLCDLVAQVNRSEENDKRFLFVRKCTRGRFKEARRRMFKGNTPAEKEEAAHEWNHLRVLGAYVSWSVVKYLRDELSKRYPAADGFSDWLKATAGLCKGLPLMWSSPLGFPVCQDKFKLKGSSLSARVDGSVVRIDVRRLGDEVANRKQRDALLPNLIHSLDATHLMMTLAEAEKQGVTEIGSIHDCLLCHPNDAATLGRAVRQTFVQLYQPGRTGWPEVLVRWREWMTQVARLNNVHQPATVLGALKYPDKLGSEILRARVRAGSETAQADLQLLNDLQTLSPLHRAFACMLLEYKRDYGSVRERAPEKERAARPVTSGETSTLPEPPLGGLRLNDPQSLSDYFFS